MPTSKPISPVAPSLKFLGEQLFVGLPAARNLGEAAKVPAQWKDFMSGPYQQISNKIECPPVGVTLPGDSDENFVYVCAAQVSSFGVTPRDLIEVTVAPSEYAVFVHDDHVSALPQTYKIIFNEWLPSSGRTPSRAASLEHHNPSFDPRTGSGGVTVWIPLA